MKKLKSLIVLLVVLLLSAIGSGQVMANPQAGDFEISPFVGYYWFDSDTGYKDHSVWGGRFGYMYDDNLEAELSVAMVSSKLNGTGRDADLLQFHVDALYNFSGLGRLVPYVAAGIGAADYDPEFGSGSGTEFLIDYGAGARYFFTDDLAVRLDLRHPIVDDAESNFMVTADLSYFFGAAKHAVKVDREEPEPEPVQVEPPAPPVDSDGDGVIDSDDRCPDSPAGIAVDADGCTPDSDGDGVFDYMDKCPETPDGAPVDEDGCFQDTDRDGLSDWQEMKQTGTDRYNPDSDEDGLDDGYEVNNSGSDPLNPDTDGGGVSDGLEVNVAGSNPLDPADDVKEIRRIELKVYFDTDSDIVKPEYLPEIEQVAVFLQDNPGVVGTVEGHTDSTGSSAYNQDLSERRARNVVRIAEENFGVEPGRLSAVGFGGTRPVADNGTADGRARNRRIEAAFSSK